MTYRIGARPSLNKHEMERLARIARQNLYRSKAHGERVAHMAEIKRRQMIRDYEAEYDSLRAASIQTGPLHRAAIQRMADLKALI